MARTFLGALSRFSLVVLLAGAAPAMAHHSFAADFDATKKGTLTGEVSHILYANPHVRYRIKVRAPDGGIQEWELQLGSITSLRGAHIDQNTIKLGDRLTVSGELGRDGKKKLYVRKITDASGKVIYGSQKRSNAKPVLLTNRNPNDFGYGKLNADAPIDISGPWGDHYKFHVTVNDLQPKPTPFTPEGRQVFAATQHLDDPALRCKAMGLPREFGSPYNMQIVDAGSFYLVVYVEHNVPRRIYMDGRKAPANLAPSSMGFSVGHWEGRTLVIETTHLLAGWLDGSGLPMSGKNTRIEERWTLAADGLSMNRTMTIYDPEYYTQPLVRQRGSARGDDVDVSEMPSCDPTSYYQDLVDAGKLKQYLDR